jgi:hypothetical protein
VLSPTDIYYCLTVTVLFLRGALSEERTGLTFVYAAGPCLRSLSRSESLGTRDHILLCQICDFPFRRCPVTEQSRALAYCRQRASTVTLGIEPRWDPWPYICSVSRPFFFFRCSSFDKKGAVGLFYNWCSLTTPCSIRGHIKVGDIYILYIFTKHKLTLSSTTYRDICQCRIVQQLMPQLI